MMLPLREAGRLVEFPAGRTVWMPTLDCVFGREAGSCEGD